MEPRTGLHFSTRRAQLGQSGRDGVSDQHHDRSTRASSASVALSRHGPQTKRRRAGSPGAVRRSAYLRRLILVTWSIPSPRLTCRSQSPAERFLVPRLKMYCPAVAS
jgi:hypothetical protein